MFVPLVTQGYVKMGVCGVGNSGGLYIHLCLCSFFFFALLSLINLLTCFLYTSFCISQSLFNFFIEFFLPPATDFLYTSSFL